MRAKLSDFDQQLDELLTAFQASALSRDWTELPALDARLRALLDIDGLASYLGEHQRAREQLDTIGQLHRRLIDVVVEERRQIGERLAQLRDDQRSADVYERVRRSTL